MDAARLAESCAVANLNIGVHAVADLVGIDIQHLKDTHFLMSKLRKSLHFASFTIMDEKCMKFPGHHSGVTGVFILSESHAAFHSYPEYRYLAVDIFSCGPANPELAIENFASIVNAESCVLRSLDRGRNARL